MAGFSKLTPATNPCVTPKVPWNARRHGLFQRGQSMKSLTIKQRQEPVGQRKDQQGIASELRIGPRTVEGRLSKDGRSQRR